MAWRIAVALVFATGCRAVFGLDPPDHKQFDAAVDTAVVPVDTRDACASDSTIVDSCTLEFGQQDITFSGIVTFSSDTKTFSTNVPAVISENADHTVVIISARSISVTSTGALRFGGSKPVALVARDQIVVDGIILASSGARTCGAAGGQDDTGGASGGAGGGFGGIGGAGGNGDSDGTISSMGGPMSPAVARPTTLVGGCAGGKGGNASGTGGPGGAGGGAVALIAPSVLINASAQIAALGLGGQGATVDAGGGGGGSGGMIVIESHGTQIMGKLAANGGGGGEGAGNNPGNDGSPGNVSTSRAQGGAGNATQGGDGGAGGAGPTPDGLASLQFLTSGGGGGGGGVGFIAITGSPNVSAGALISPPFGSWP